MKKTFTGIILMLMLTALAACGNDSNGGTSASGASPAPSASAEASAPASSEPASGTKTVKYLDQEYTVPASTERIAITGAMEAMEDSILLDIHPVGAIAVSGKFPPLFAPITDKADFTGEKMEPNFEKILSLKPDVILATTKFNAAELEKLGQIAPTIPYSHIATNWEANLTLLGELSGKQDKAAELISEYKADLEKAKGSVESKLKDKKVLIVRIRAGAVCIYGKDLFFNPVLYGDLGLKLPDEVAAANKQEALSIEQFAKINPDILFIQFSEDENPEATGALNELQKNPIYKSIQAVKDGKVFVNAIDPLAQGGTAYSKIQFLKIFQEKTES